MNERIRQLLVEAREQTKEGKWNAPTSVWTEKFAELIVRECGAVAYKAYWKNPETVRGRHIEEQIREHFGVE